MHEVRQTLTCSMAAESAVVTMMPVMDRRAELSSHLKSPTKLLLHTARYMYACRCYPPNHLCTVGIHSVLPSYPGSWCRCLDAMRLLSARGAVQVLGYCDPMVLGTMRCLLSGHVYARVRCAAVEGLDRRSGQLAILEDSVTPTVHSMPI
jgi:hypothetical protein